MKNSLRNVSIQTLSIGVCFFLLLISPTHSQKDPIPNPKLKSSSNTILPKPDDQKVPTLDQKPKLGSPIGSPIVSPIVSPKPSIDDKKDNSIDPKLKSSSNSPKSPIYEQMDLILDVKPKANSNYILAKPPSQDQKHPTPDSKSKSSSNSAPPKSPIDDHKDPTPDPKSKSSSNTTSPKPPTDAHKNPAQDKSKPNSNTSSPKSPTNTHKNPKPDSKTNPNTNSTSSKPKPNPIPIPPITKSKPNPNPTPSQTKPNTTSPYHVANNFCLSRRLDVRNTFCLMVLRSSPNSTKAKDNQALLDIAADSAIKFGNKTILFLKNLSKDKKTKLDLKPVIDECLSAYDGFITQYNMLVEETRVEAEMPSYDAELAKLEINRCVKALSKSKNDDVAAQNKVALDYTKLAQNIADSIE